jgi:transcriptional regulator with XRE-family HTH domain
MAFWVVGKSAASTLGEDGMRNAAPEGAALANALSTTAFTGPEGYHRVICGQISLRIPVVGSPGEARRRERMPSEASKEQRDHLSRRLKEWRADQGLTQAQAANHIGISTRSYEDYEAGRALPRTAALRQLEEATGVDWHELIGEREEGVERLEAELERMRETIDELRAEMGRMQERVERPKPESSRRRDDRRRRRAEVVRKSDRRTTGDNRP